MSSPTDTSTRSHRIAAAARDEEQALRARWDARQRALRERLSPSWDRASRVTRRALGWFPVRVWRHFLQHNGFLLAAGVSYQALFSTFAAIYVAFAAVGLWLGGNAAAVQGLIEVINAYVPGLIGEEETSLISVEQVQLITHRSIGVLAVTGAVALVAAAWTATTFVTYARRAVRDIFALPYDDRAYLWLKARDLLAAVCFALALVLGTVLTAAGTWSLRAIFRYLGWTTNSPWYETGIQLLSVVISLGINTGAVASLCWFLTGTSRRWRTIWPGSLVGGIGLTALQLLTGLLLAFTPTNPLLATFTLFVGLLLWFRIVGIVLLVAAAWIAVTAEDENVSLRVKTEAERLWDEHQALVSAARRRLRTAAEAVRDAPWYRRRSARQYLLRAQRELEEVEADAPPVPERRSRWLFE